MSFNPDLFRPDTQVRNEYIAQLLEHHRTLHPPLDVIMVTYNNPEYAGRAIHSLLATWVVYPFRLYVVNNGHPDCIPPIESGATVTVLQQSKNLGWEGGVKAGLEASDAPYVVLVNDDIHIPRASMHWARMLMEPMRNPDIGAIGPTSNFVSGFQNIGQQPWYQFFPTTYLIGFFMLLRREALSKVSYPDFSLPGGDDIDLSIQLRNAGYSLVVRNDLFIFHHGEITGKRLHGERWNHADMIDNTANGLIRKHGLKTWFKTVYDQGAVVTESLFNMTEPETSACAHWAPGEPAVVLEMGCGGQLTVPHAVGIDKHASGEVTPWKHTSIASVVADVFRPMPIFNDEHADAIIARHILEHAIDPIQVLREWHRILKPGGRLIVAVPNEEICDGIPMDHTHLHGFTPDSLRSLMEAVGYTQVAYTPDCGNNMSMVGVYEK